MMKIYPNNTKVIPFKNVARDFSSDFVYFGKTKSGRMKVGDISGHGPNGITVYKNRLTKVSLTPEGKKRHRIHTGGSPFNTYYFDE